MTLLSVMNFRSKYANAPHPTLAIDGEPLDRWLLAHTGEDRVDGLYPAVLADRWPQNTALAWRRLQPRRQGQHVIVPLLVCPDCLDFSCTTLVVQQQKTAEAIVWHRFGLCSSPHHLRLDPTVAWFDRTVSARFEPAAFEAALQALRRAAETPA